MLKIPDLKPIVSLTGMAMKAAGGAFKKFKKMRVAAKRRKIAKDFYKKAGWNPKRIKQHLDGIDFNKPVDVITIPKGTKVVQHQVPGNKVGTYFAPPGTPATKIGVNPAGRTPTNYSATKDVEVLRSTASAPIDNWSIAGTSYQTQGGGTQYFVPNPSVFQ